jgi:hypothetical protein
MEDRSIPTGITDKERERKASQPIITDDTEALSYSGGFPDELLEQWHLGIDLEEPDSYDDDV